MFWLLSVSQSHRIATRPEYESGRRAAAMYEAFFGQFGLQQNPFPVAPNPKKYFSTTAHDEALLQLVFGIQSRKGLMILTGEPGTGKTTILHYLLEWLRENKYSTAYV